MQALICLLSKDITSMAFVVILTRHQSVSHSSVLPKLAKQVRNSEHVLEGCIFSKDTAGAIISCESPLSVFKLMLRKWGTF